MALEREALFQWARTQMVISVRLDYNDSFFVACVAIKAEYEDNYKNLFISLCLVLWHILSGNVTYKKVVIKVIKRFAIAINGNIFIILG